MGSVCASDVTNVSDTEDSNLIQDNNVLSSQNLEVSNENSISETNIVNSHDDNLNDYPDNPLGISADDGDNLSSSDGDGNGSVLSASDDSDLLTAKQTSSLTIANTHYNKIVKFQVTLKAGGKAISGQKVTLTVNGKSYSGTTGSNGIATIATTNLAVGKYTVTASYGGNGNYASASKKATVSVLSSISANDFTKGYGYVAKYTATFYKDNVALANSNVEFTISGKTYTAKTNSKGVAQLAVGLNPGKYSLKIYNPTTGEKITRNVVVSSSISASDLTKGYGYVAKYTATFFKNNSPLANAKVDFTISGKTYTAKTNSKGVAQLAVGLNPGKHSLTLHNPATGEKVTRNVVVTKDQTTLSNVYSTTYVQPKTAYTYTVTLKSKHNVAISGQNVYFKFNGKQITAKTNSNGKASMTIPALSKGTYSISYSFKENNFYYGSSGSGTVKVQDSTTKLTSSTLKSTYKDKSSFKVKLTDKSGKALTGKNVKIAVSGKTYNVKTDAKGVASLEIGLSPKTYTVKYAYSSRGLADFSEGSNSIIVSKQTASLTAGDLDKKQGETKNYYVTVKDIYGKPLKSVKVNIKIAGKTYSRTTNSNGVASLPIGLNMGSYKIASQVVDNNYYTSKVVTKTVYVDGVKFVASPANMPGGNGVYSIKLLNVKNKPIKDATVKIAFNGKTVTTKSDSNGIAKLEIKGLAKGTYDIRFASDGFVGTSKVYVGTKVTLSQVIAASKNVKNYIETNKKLPAYVNIGSTKFTNAQYLYVASKAIVNLKKGSTSDLYVFEMKSPSNPGSDATLGNLYDYESVAKNVVSYSDSNAALPNSASSKVGTIGYNGLVYTFSNVLTYYGNSKSLPGYATVKAYSYSVDPAYLAATANCQVNNAQIKALAAKLTSGKSSDWDKASAIFNYVRDHTSYSFYYNTRYGAVGTLNSGQGNCVDHAHLCTALFRAAGLGARYVHGTCTFSYSGSVYGHVWSQVYVNGKWVVADASSNRNSLGNHVSWSSGSIHGYYTSLPF